MTINVEQITSQLRMLPDPQLQKYAQMHKNDPYIMSLAVNESNMRKQMRAAQQARMAGQQQQPKVVDQAVMSMNPQPAPQPAPGIAALQAPNVESMADGGIAGYDETQTPGAFDYAGRTEPVIRMAAGSNPLQQYASLIREEAERQGVDPDLAMRLFMAESSGNPDAVSPKGAVGLGQLMPAAAKDMGLDPSERRDPIKNIRASIGYFARQQQKYGDTQKALAAYNWGPANLDKHLERNQGQLNVTGLPKETADYLTKLLPIRAAQAATAPQKPGTDLVSQIPGQTAAGRTTTPEAAPGDRTLLDRLFGAGEAATSMATGLAAIPLGAGRKLLQEAAYGRSDPMADQMARYTFAPRGEAGKEYVSGIAKVAQDLKVPGYVPAATPIGPGLRAATQMGRAGAQADEAAAAAAQAAAPRIPGQLVSDTRVPGEVAVPSTAVPGKPAITNIPTSGEAARQAAALAAQREAAAAAAQRSGAAQQGAAAAQIAGERMGAEGAYTGAAGARANLAGAAGTAAQAAPGAEVPPETPFVPTPGDGSYDRLEKRRFIEQGLSRLEDDVSKADLLKKAKAEAPEAGKKGWTAEDWMLLGLGLMASQKRGLAALGEAGLGVVANKRAVAKEEREEAYRKALTREAEAKAKVYESGVGDVAKATAYADKAFDNWLNGVKANPMLQMNITPEQIEAKRREYLREAYAMFKIEMPATVGAAGTDGFKVLGSRPS